MQEAQFFFELLGFGASGWGWNLLKGTIVTIELAISSVVVGMLLGIFLSLCKLSSWQFLRLLSNSFTLFIRGIPEFLVLLIVFYFFTNMIEGLLASVGVRVEIPKFVAAVIGLSIIFGTYASEVLKGAFIAVPIGQIEAAKSVGMTQRQVFFHVRLPQVWRFAIPGLGNLWMVLLKDTSLAAVIAIDDVLRVAKVGSESTQEPLTFYLAAGAIYLLLSGVSDFGRMKLENHSRRGIQ